MSERPPSPPPVDPPVDAGRRGKPADAVLAAELALGVLDPAARVRAEARAAQDDAFAADAAGWTARLHPLTEEVVAVEPSAALWERIERAAGLVAAAPPAPAARAESAPRLQTAEIVPLRQPASATRWRAAALGGFALAAASLAALAFLVLRPVAVSAPLLAARLGPAGGTGPALVAAEPLFTAALDRGRGAVLMTPISPGPVDPRARELWLIPAGGKPIAVGLVDVAHIAALPLKPDLLRLSAAGATLAVSLEPAGGSPTGAPTGPVIAAGVLARI